MSVDPPKAMSPEEWQAWILQRLDSGDKRFDLIDQRFDTVDKKLGTNTDICQKALDVSVEGNKKIDEMRGELREVIVVAGGTRRTGRFIAWVARGLAKLMHQLARWAAPILTAGATAWALYEAWRQWRGK